MRIQINLLLPEIGVRIGIGKRFNEYLQNYSTANHPQFFLHIFFSNEEEVKSPKWRMVSLQVHLKYHKIIVSRCYLTLFRFVFYAWISIYFWNLKRDRDFSLET